MIPVPELSPAAPAAVPTGPMLGTTSGGSTVPPSNARLRPRPAERFAGPEHRIALASVLAALRVEPHDGKDRHRQITVFSNGALRIVLFAFEAGGRLAAHRAPGFVVIMTTRGRVRVRTNHEVHELSAGEILVLDPDVEHDVEAQVEADVMLTVSLIP